MKRIGASFLIGIFFLTVWIPAKTFGQTGQPPAPSVEMQKANGLFNEKKWAEAILAFQSVTKAEPNNGQAWFRLGFSHHSLGQFEAAIEPYRKAIAIGNNPLAMYNLACVHSRLKQTDPAFEWLNKAITAGFLQLQKIQTDTDLENLRSDARYPEIEKAVDKAGNPCKYEPKCRQFDFWIGEWDVTAKGQTVSTSSIQLILGNCVIFENYTNGPYIGKSFNFYDAVLGKWRQTWVDRTGGVIEFAGEFKDGSMRFEGEGHQINGTKSLQRMTFTPLEKDKVRQLGETSTDGGKTWTVSYDFIYVRKNN